MRLIKKIQEKIRKRREEKGKCIECEKRLLNYEKEYYGFTCEKCEEKYQKKIMERVKRKK